MHVYFQINTMHQNVINHLTSSNCQILILPRHDLGVLLIQIPMILTMDDLMHLHVQKRVLVKNQKTLPVISEDL